MTSATAGNLVVHDFGPWGNARNGSTPATQLAEGQRGFTGHEHLAELGLIHMNGRIYDPVIGRFLQADPIIQAPQNAQSHNRYSYVLNNPLSFSDPSGFSWWTKHRRMVVGIAAGILTAGVASWAMGAYAFANGATIFASAGGVVNGFGVATAAAAGGFASGGIMGGNIQSALRGAFMALVTVGLMQGLSDALGGSGLPGEVPSGGQMGASTASADLPGATMSDAPSGMGSSMPAEQSWISAPVDGVTWRGTESWPNGTWTLSYARYGVGNLQPGGIASVFKGFFGITAPGVALGVCAADGCGGWGWLGGAVGSIPILGATKFAAPVASSSKLSGSTVLYRRGGSDSISALRSQSAAAEAAPNIGVHGVSVSLNPAGRYAGQVVRCATCAEFESAGFDVLKTGLGPDHYTIVLPKTISPEIARIWNSLLTIRP